MQPPPEAWPPALKPAASTDSNELNSYDADVTAPADLDPPYVVALSERVLLRAGDAALDIAEHVAVGEAGPFTLDAAGLDLLALYQSDAAWLGTLPFDAGRDAYGPVMVSVTATGACAAS